MDEKERNHCFEFPYNAWGKQKRTFNWITGATATIRWPSSILKLLDIMSFNSSSLTENQCPLFYFIVTENSSTFNQTLFAFCVVTALFAQLTVAANAFILAAFLEESFSQDSMSCSSCWTGSYWLLHWSNNPTLLCRCQICCHYNWRRKLKFCDAKLVADGFGYYFSGLTVLVMTLMAVERWLHMSQRSLLTARRVVITYISFAVLLFLLVVAGSMYVGFYGHKAFKVILIFVFSMGVLCVLVTAFAYFKVFQIIRQHQNQVMFLICSS